MVRLCLLEIELSLAVFEQLCTVFPVSNTSRRRQLNYDWLSGSLSLDNALCINVIPWAESCMWAVTWENVPFFDMCAQRSPKSACSSAHFDHSLHEESFRRSYPKCAQLRLWSAQDDLNLRWTHMAKGTFSNVAAHIDNRGNLNRCFHPLIKPLKRKNISTCTKDTDLTDLAVCFGCIPIKRGLRTDFR